MVSIYQFLKANIKQAATIPAAYGIAYTVKHDR